MPYKHYAINCPCESGKILRDCHGKGFISKNFEERSHYFIRKIADSQDEKFISNIFCQHHYIQCRDDFEASLRAMEWLKVKSMKDGDNTHLPIEIGNIPEKYPSDLPPSEMLGYIERGIEEKRPLLVFLNELQAALGHDFGEILAVGFYRGGALVEVVKTGSVEEVVVVVVDESVANAEKFVEALLLRAIVAMRTEMPFAKERCSVTVFLQSFGQRDFIERHVDALGTIHVTLRPVIDAASLRVTPGEQGSPCWTAHGMGIGLGEAHPGGRQFVDGGSAQVLGPVAIGIEGALVVGEQDHHVGLGSHAGRAGSEKGE